MYLQWSQRVSGEGARSYSAAVFDKPQIFIVGTPPSQQSYSGVRDLLKIAYVAGGEPIGDCDRLVAEAAWHIGIALSSDGLSNPRIDRVDSSGRIRLPAPGHDCTT